MPVDIDTMRSEVNIQSSSANSTGSTSASMTSIDEEQLREIIRELVLEIVTDDLYSLFRMRGL